MATRIQVIDGQPILEITEQVTEKRQYKEEHLLRERAYFAEMKTKAEAGLARVDSLLTQLQNGTGEL